MQEDHHIRSERNQQEILRGLKTCLIKFGISVVLMNFRERPFKIPLEISMKQKCDAELFSFFIKFLLTFNLDINS